MKKVFALVVSLFIYMPVYADAKTQNLECESNYSLFKDIIIKKSDSNTISNEREIYDYLEKYDYSYLFNDKHINQRFWPATKLIYGELEWSNNEWISQKEYNNRIKKIAKNNIKNSSNTNVYELLKTKGNVKTKIGEICVVPVQTYFKVKGDNNEDLFLEGMLSDHIFVRSIKTNEWRVLEFNRYIKDTDFNEFFPDIPENIKNELNDGIIEAEEAEEAGVFGQ